MLSRGRIATASAWRAAATCSRRACAPLTAAASPRSLFASSCGGITVARAPSSVGALSVLSLKSASFAVLRARGGAYVDKTSAIADLLASDEALSAFFARPRKFGKSLTLDVAATMLAAGALPAGVVSWPGYAPVNIDAVFGGLAVHERLRRRDPSLRGLLERAHFVLSISLGGAQTGCELKGRIISRIASVAGNTFGCALETKVRLAATPDEAVEMLVSAVPLGVPVALLVDDYDGAIIQDVAKGRWAAADDGLAALRSLFMSTKAPDVGSRIERCLVTGVTRFARTSLFLGANNFSDLTNDPLLSRAIGFSEVEIRATFPDELRRVAASLGKDVDGAVAELARWYNGYCFDGVTTCFNPFPVLVALEVGEITEKEMAGASGVHWLGLTPRSLTTDLVEALQAGVPATATRVDVADLEARRVEAVPLLLQLGLLSPTAGQPSVCRPPNEYAVQSLQHMADTALVVESADFGRMAAALRHRSCAAFVSAATTLLENIPRRIIQEGRQGWRGCTPRVGLPHWPCVLDAPPEPARRRRHV